MNYTKITISGLICTGKTSLFWGLQRKLIWPTFSASQFFRDYARTHNALLEKAEEQSQKLTREVDNRMQNMLKQRGNLIIEGWMAGIMANQQNDVLRVLLQCDDEVRYARFANREKVTLVQAKERVQEREKNLFVVLQQIYHRNDFVDQKNYNFIIDSTYLTMPELVEKTLNALGYPADGIEKKQ
ncbi:AAA family ATPase [Candidatus Roizmanbacteria bacterium]|nr:AAA family ATPase [Candidatus Roizmanbacteria bacterium]